MVKLSQMLVVTLCSFGVTSAAVWHGPLPAKPEEFKNVEGCYIKETNTVLKFGEEITAPVGFCYTIRCNKDEIAYAGCGKRVVGSPGSDFKNCHDTEYDLRKSYPDCCPITKCD